MYLYVVICLVCAARNLGLMLTGPSNLYNVGSLSAENSAQVSRGAV